MSLQEQTARDIADAIANARTWLGELDECTVREKPSPERWSIAEVMGHLIDSANNNHQRFIRAQDAESLTFPKYDQNQWVANAGYHDSPWDEILDLWALYNLQLARTIARIPTSQLETECTITPYEPCTLGYLITDYLDHLNHHLSIVRQRVSP